MECVIFMFAVIFVLSNSILYAYFKEKTDELKTDHDQLEDQFFKILRHLKLYLVKEEGYKVMTEAEYDELIKKKK